VSWSTAEVNPRADFLHDRPSLPSSPSHFSPPKLDHPVYGLCDSRMRELWAWHPGTPPDGRECPVSVAIAPHDVLFVDQIVDDVPADLLVQSAQSRVEKLSAQSRDVLPKPTMMLNGQLSSSRSPYHHHPIEELLPYRGACSCSSIYRRSCHGNRPPTSPYDFLLWPEGQTLGHRAFPYHRPTGPSSRNEVFGRHQVRAIFATIFTPPGAFCGSKSIS